MNLRPTALIQVEKATLDYMKTLPDFDRVFEMSKSSQDVTEPFGDNPYQQYEM